MRCLGVIVRSKPGAQFMPLWAQLAQSSPDDPRSRYERAQFHVTVESTGS